MHVAHAQLSTHLEQLGRLKFIRTAAQRTDHSISLRQRHERALNHARSGQRPFCEDAHPGCRLSRTVRSCAARCSRACRPLREFNVAGARTMLWFKVRRPTFGPSAGAFPPRAASTCRTSPFIVWVIRCVPEFEKRWNCIRQTARAFITASLIARSKCCDPSSTAQNIGTCLPDETAHTTGDQWFMSSAGTQGQPKFREIFRP
jgi:hypothetical protein